jgi:hypothetical protein
MRDRCSRTVPDLLVAAAGEARSPTVLHCDADFDRIAVMTGQPCRWVVRRLGRLTRLSALCATTRGLDQDRWMRSAGRSSARTSKSSS